jgi:hypothetical protein
MVPIIVIVFLVTLNVIALGNQIYLDIKKI